MAPANSNVPPASLDLILSILSKSQCLNRMAKSVVPFVCLVFKNEFERASTTLSCRHFPSIGFFPLIFRGKSFFFPWSVSLSTDGVLNSPRGCMPPAAGWVSATVL
jgi:hypothetical protein